MLPHHAVNSLSALMVGNLRNRTCVDNTNISLLPISHCRHTQIMQQTSESRGFREIKFTPKSEKGRLFALKSRSINHLYIINLNAKIV